MLATRRNNIHERGRPVVLAHGLGCDQTVWRSAAPAFGADHRVVLFGPSPRSLDDEDYRGDLPAVRVPTLVLQTTQEVIAPIEVGRCVHEHIAGSRFRS